MFLIMGICYIAFFVGFSFASVGTIPICKPVSAQLPFTLLIALTSPFVLGYLAGRKNNE